MFAPSLGWEAHPKHIGFSSMDDERICKDQTVWSRLSDEVRWEDWITVGTTIVDLQHEVMKEFRLTRPRGAGMLGNLGGGCLISTGDGHPTCSDGA
jgi:hypothetical protein